MSPEICLSKNQASVSRLGYIALKDIANWSVRQETLLDEERPKFGVMMPYTARFFVSLRMTLVHVGAGSRMARNISRI